MCETAIQKAVFLYHERPNLKRRARPFPQTSLFSQKIWVTLYHPRTYALGGYASQS